MEKYLSQRIQHLSSNLQESWKSQICHDVFTSVLLWWGRKRRKQMTRSRWVIQPVYLGHEMLSHISQHVELSTHYHTLTPISSLQHMSTANNYKRMVISSFRQNWIIYLTKQLSYSPILWHYYSTGDMQGPSKPVTICCLII